MGNGDAKENITHPDESEVPGGPSLVHQHPKGPRISPAPVPSGQGGVGEGAPHKGGKPAAAAEDSVEWQSAPGAEHLDINVGTAQHGKGGSSGP